MVITFTVPQFIFLMYMFYATAAMLYEIDVYPNYTLDFFNPWRNLEKWEKINTFWTITFTICLNILLFPCALLYWVRHA